MDAYDFWTKSGCADSGTYPLATLALRPGNEANANVLKMLFKTGTPVDEQLAVADRVLAGVQRWRDGIAEAAQTERTAVDELAAAREEIAQLKAERDGGEGE
ncbi:hypothetical protein [Streptomyces sp. B21-083]|uniref:hypothetical protein n=1 Tax=Streptomyces sp. B21-083 TaxID=3039410 RepID=UPI002FF2ABDB